MARTIRPVFTELSREECEELLARNEVGRLAYSFRDRVGIEPIHYVYAEGWVYGRTAPGAKLETVLHNPWVAFEVDEVHGTFDWRSVVVTGRLYILDPAEGDRDAEIHAKAVELLRGVVYDALSPGDPTPARSVVFRIDADGVTGRMARPSP